MRQHHIRRACAAVAIQLLATATTSALAREGAWTEGFGQGNLEYFIDGKGWRLYIGCPTQDGSADATSSVSLISVSTNKAAAKFTIHVGGNTYKGPFEADSRVGENIFISLLQDLRKSDAIAQAGNMRITFPKSNVAKVVPVYGKGFKCNMG